MTTPDEPPIYALLAPIPVDHFNEARRMLDAHEYVAFGSEAFEVLRRVVLDAPVYIYVSHATAELVVQYKGVFRGLVHSPLEMHKLRKSGYRPKTTEGEDWRMYWLLGNPPEKEWR